MPRQRVLEYAGPRTREPKLYGPIPRRQVFINFISLAIGAWLFFGISCGDIMFSICAFPLLYAVVAAQIFTSLWPTRRFILKSELPLSWFDLGILVIPMRLGMAGTIGAQLNLRL